jgi:3-oxoacyl-(acyl-carrier-protein) synthase
MDVAVPAGRGCTSEGLADAVLQALGQGECRPGDVDVVVSASADGDSREAEALARVFGDRAPPRLASVHATGYLEACGALLAAVALVTGGGWGAEAPAGPRTGRMVLVVGSSGMGNNHVLLLGT